jgi:hypothetical protein
VGVCPVPSLNIHYVPWLGVRQNNHCNEDTHRRLNPEDTELISGIITILYPGNAEPDAAGCAVLPQTRTTKHSGRWNRIQKENRGWRGIAFVYAGRVVA